MACITTCTPTAITSASGNCQKGGVIAAFLTSFDSVDWTTMAGNTFFTAATDLILNFAMEGAAVFVPFTPEKKTLGNVSTFAGDAATWTNVLSGTANGLTNANRLALKNMQCCDLVAVLFTADCQAIMIGAEYIRGAWVKTLDPLRLNAVVMNTFLAGGTDKASNAITLQGVSYNAPYFIDSAITLADFITDFT